MNTTYFAFLAALLHDIYDCVSAFFQGKGDVASHFRLYQNTFETYASGFGAFGWTLYGFSLLFLVGILLSVGLFITFEIRRHAELKKAPIEGTSSPSNVNAESNRFPSLRLIDQAFLAQTDVPLLDKPKTLEKICDEFRDYAAFQWGLYYDIALIRRFVSALSCTHLILLEGVSGTGKTSLPCRFADYCSGKADVVPVEPSWREKSELLGYYNDFNREYRQTPFLESLYRALYEKGIHFIILDEVNLSRIEYYFAEFLSLLELPKESRRLVPLIGNAEAGDPKLLIDGKLPLGENVYFIGTANHDDSTFAITDKVYDRAISLSFLHHGQAFDAARTTPTSLSYSFWVESFENARRDHPLSKDKSQALEDFLRFLTQETGIVIGNRILSQIDSFVPTYQACGGSEEDALDFFITSKILRKIDTLSTAKKQGFVQIRRQIDHLFGITNLPLVDAFLEERGL